MRIALVSDTYTPQVNGVTTVLRRIARAADEAGHQLAIIAPSYPDWPNQLAGELRVWSVPFPLYPAIRLSLPRTRAVSRFLDAFGPDLVHVATEGPLGLVGRRYALRRGLPLVTSAHTDFPAYCRHYAARRLAPLAWRWLSWFHGPASLTHAPGNAMKNQLHDAGVERVEVWGCGVDTSHFRPSRRSEGLRRELGVAGGVIVLHVGRLAAEKNLAVLIDSWHRARERLTGHDVVFVVAGAGPLARRVEREMPWVRRLGFLGPDELADLYASADICVLPSHTETCGLVALEAMASALPAIAADAGGFRESITDGRTGILLSPTDSAAFASSILRLVVNVEERLHLGAAARAAAVTRGVTEEDRRLFEQYRRLIIGPRDTHEWRAA